MNNLDFGGIPFWFFGLFLDYVTSFFENVQTLTSFLLAQSLILSTSQLPKPISKELETFLSRLLPSFTNTIVLKCILPCLSLNLSMLWRLCKVNKSWLRLQVKMCNGMHLRFAKLTMHGNFKSLHNSKFVGNLFKSASSLKSIY